MVHLVVNSSDDASVGMLDDDRMNSKYDNLWLADKGCFSYVPVKGLVHLMGLLLQWAVSL